jgi:hypothetical protein
MPKKIREITTMFVLKVLATLSTNINPPAMIIIRITARLKDEVHVEKMLFSF